MSFFSDIMGFLSEIMQQLLTYCYDFTHMIGFPSYGVAIILLTLAIKFILAPLTVKQILGLITQDYDILNRVAGELQKKLIAPTQEKTKPVKAST